MDSDLLALYTHRPETRLCGLCGDTEQDVQCRAGQMYWHVCLDCADRIEQEYPSFTLVSHLPGSYPGNLSAV